MKSTAFLRRRPVRLTMSCGLVLGAGVVAAACGTTSPGTSTGASAHSAVASAGTGAQAGVTISARNVPGFGTVLVNGKGRTLYLLSSEKSGKVTCTDATGCTRIWPATELRKGVAAAKAGNGVDAALLGTVDSDGARYVTYNHHPLYTYVGDTAAGQASGEGIVSFGGPWYVLNTAGNAVTHRASSAASSPASGGYGY